MLFISYSIYLCLEVATAILEPYRDRALVLAIAQSPSLNGANARTQAKLLRPKHCDRPQKNAKRMGWAIVRPNQDCQV
jgi:hypothetical protein